jgi:hypothetical protein
VPDRPKQQLMLLNLLHAPDGSMLHRLATALTRIEDLSHVLAWTASKVGDITNKRKQNYIHLMAVFLFHLFA